MRCLIIHNPASGPSSDEIYAFTHALAQGGDEVVMRFIGDGMEPEDAVADVREFDRVVVSGGDGTVSNVLDQMRGCGVPTLIFPSGTACLFFNNIGNAPEAAALAKACRAGRTVKVDMGELFWLDEDGNEKRHGFIIIAGSGFDAEIMMKAAPTKNDIGEIAYFLSALATPNPRWRTLRLSMTALSRSSTASAAWPATPRSSKTTSTCSPTAAWTTAWSTSSLLSPYARCSCSPR